MTITPDTKDWTWVLARPCPECDLDTQAFPVEAVPGMVMANAAAWQDALAGPEVPGDARTRPEPAKWSPLEYGCHVRTSQVSAPVRPASARDRGGRAPARR